MTVEMAQTNFLVPVRLKHVNRWSSVVQTVLTSVYQAPGAVMEKPTVRMELMRRTVRPGSAQTLNSAARTASVCRPPSCATMRQTVTMPATRPPARPPPAAVHRFSATTLFAFLACGPATVTSTALMARMNGPRTAAQRLPPLLPRTNAPPWSSVVAAESASMVVGSVMEVLTAMIDPMKLTVLNPPAVLMSFNAVMDLASMAADSVTISTTAGT